MAGGQGCDNWVPHGHLPCLASSDFTFPLGAKSHLALPSCATQHHPLQQRQASGHSVYPSGLSGPCLLTRDEILPRDSYQEPPQGDF